MKGDKVRRAFCVRYREQITAAATAATRSQNRRRAFVVGFIDSN